LSSQEPAGALEVLNEAGRGVRVEFHEFGDRFRHVILAIRGESRTPVLKSFEGDESQVLPHIPCFQEFHQQGQTLFLTGASSTGHWSMSVQVAEARFLSFDVACRLRESGRHVGSEYLLADSLDCRLDEVATTATVVDPATDAPGLQMLGSAPFSCQVSRADGTNLRLSSPAEPLSLPATVQWRYGVWMT
jgi:hypothetical protein